MTEVVITIFAACSNFGRQLIAGGVLVIKNTRRKKIFQKGQSNLKSSFASMIKSLLLEIYLFTLYYRKYHECTEVYNDCL